MPWGQHEGVNQSRSIEFMQLFFSNCTLYLCIFQEIVETVEGECCENGKLLANDLFLGKRPCWEHTFHLKLSKFVHKDLISIRILLIRNLHILCHVSAMLTDEWNFAINLCKMYWNWNKYLFILRPCASLSSWLCFNIFYFSAFILKNILSLLSSLSAFYFPIPYLNRFHFEVLESSK